MKTARSIAFDALLQVEREDAYLNLILPKFLEEARLSKPDAAFATELSYGASRFQGFYDWVIERVTSRKPSTLDLEVLIMLRLGAHQLLELNTPAHAAIYEQVQLAKKVIGQSVAGFINASLRRISERSRVQWLNLVDQEEFGFDESLAIKTSHPLWIERAIRLALDSENRVNELEEALEANNINPKVNLVALPHRKVEKSDSLSKRGISPLGYELAGGLPSDLDSVKTGSMRVQDQGSQIAALCLSEVAEVSNGEQWLDLCAGPGGKAALLASIASLHGAELTTNEVSVHRAKLVETAMRHSGLSANQLNLDGRDILSNGVFFDRIMIDAPCTGLGALRRRPESRWRKTKDDLKSLSAIQRELMTAAWSVLKTGGFLAYVTCSPHPSETSSQIEWFLRGNKDAEIIDATAVARKVSPAIALAPGRKTVQLWPHRNQTDAMFICLIRKSAN